MAIAATAAATATASQAAAASKSLAGTYDSFLKLLTTQLQHQDPLSPLDSNEFISQLVAFAGVEQQINSNSNLEKLIGLQNNGLATSAVGFIGKTVKVSGNTTNLSDGMAKFGYSLPSAAKTVDLAVLDASGHVVYATPGEPSLGDHSFTWNGQDMNGNALPNGNYSIRVTAQSASGNPIQAETSAYGKVTGIANDASGLALLIGDLQVSVYDVKAITE
jgi:flagellar basal-body rod modification protein FlgD